MDKAMSHKAGADVAHVGASGANPECCCSPIDGFYYMHRCEGEDECPWYECQEDCGTFVIIAGLANILWDSRPQTTTYRWFGHCLTLESKDEAEFHPLDDLPEGVTWVGNTNNVLLDNPHDTCSDCCDVPPDEGCDCSVTECGNLIGYNVSFTAFMEVEVTANEDCGDPVDMNCFDSVSGSFHIPVDGYFPQPEYYCYRSNLEDIVPADQYQYSIGCVEVDNIPTWQIHIQLPANMGSVFCPDNLWSGGDATKAQNSWTALLGPKEGCPGTLNGSSFTLLISVLEECFPDASVPGLIGWDTTTGMTVSVEAVYDEGGGP